MLRMKCFWPALFLALLIGCHNDKQPTQKEVANKQWNGARATVLGGVATNQYETGNLDKSRQTLNEALRLDPDNAKLHVLSAKLHIEQSELEAADRELKIARDAEPKNAEAEYLAGVVYQRWQKPDLAAQFYQRASEKNPEELAYVLARAEMLVAMDRSREALALLQEKAAHFEHNAVVRDALGQLLMQQGDYAQAADMLRQAAMLAPDDPGVREHLALALYAGKQYREAGDALSRLLKEEHHARRADLWTALGECQMQLGRPRDARSSFETAASLDGASSTVWLNVAKVAFQLNDLKRAELSLNKSLALAPASSEANLMLGYLRLRQQRLSDALAAFQTASSLDRTDAVSVCMMGYVLQKQGRPDRALGYYAAALQLKPDDELATKLMAEVQFRD